LSQKKNRVIMNDDIRATELRCNVDGGESLGIISFDEAMEKANELGQDLVLIAPDAKPPTVSIDIKKRKNSKNREKIR